VTLAITTAVADDGVTVVSVKGQLDLSTAPALREKLLALFSNSGYPEHLILDLRQVPFIDSTALGVLVGTHRRLNRDGGRMTVVVNESLQRIMRIAGLDKMWTVVEELPHGKPTDRKAEPES
jgi:anti-sigma B factor antagonist